MKKIKYSIYRPSGNDTAIVLGNSYNNEQKKVINDYIMNVNKNVEQVGFINTNGKFELDMAGGEFCGNATRSAIYNYLGGNKGEVDILVNSEHIIKGGIDDNYNVWCEIPIYNGEDAIMQIEKDVYIVKMIGIVMVVFRNFQDNKYLKSKEKLKELGKDLIGKYQLESNQAVGVMFCERNKESIKINPVVWVKNIDTLFYETACGSGSTAVGIVEAYLQNKNQRIKILQPSGLFIEVNIDYNDEKILKAAISGNVMIIEKIIEIYL